MDRQTIWREELIHILLSKEGFQGTKIKPSHEMIMRAIVNLRRLNYICVHVNPQGDCYYTHFAYKGLMKFRKYTYRSLPYDDKTIIKLYHVSGKDLVSGHAGVLEWCRSKVDAQEIFNKMQLTEEFADLKMAAWEMVET